MIKSLHDVIAQTMPAYRTLLTVEHENGLRIENKTVPFGTILIIYESRPDVTVEAAAIALKSGNRILLKGGKEARRSNLLLHQCWEEALTAVGLEAGIVRYLNMNRTQMQEFLKQPDTPIDLIIPRGGEKLIAYVKSIALCPVLVSGRGNNFLYVASKADLKMALSIIVKSKISKISACNALDKVLVDQRIDEVFVADLTRALEAARVEIITQPSAEEWAEEFLAMKIVVARVSGLKEAITLINKYSGQHSASIITTDKAEAELFMEQVDCAAVYHNASTRFTDGGQFGLGAEMAISTEKLHHRGPLGLDQLVTNKWFVYGDGQVR
jgi:glutamate-5-semialdehyde dehydrogenase